MTRDEIEVWLGEVRGYCDKASRGRWYVDTAKINGTEGQYVEGPIGSICDLYAKEHDSNGKAELTPFPNAFNDAEFIARSREDLPKALTLIEAQQRELERLRELLQRAVRGLKCIGEFHYECGDEPHSLDCSLAGRVSRVFCTGMTRSIELCREFGEDPEHQEREARQ